MNAASIASEIATATHWAWTTSLIVALPALLFLALGRAQRFPSAVRWLIGAALLVRLLLPSVPHLAIASWLPSHALGSQVTNVPESHAPAVKRESVAISVAQRLTAIKATIPAFRIGDALPWLWLAGCGIVGLWVLGSHHVIRRRIARHAAPCDEEELHLHLRWAAKRMKINTVPALLTMEGLPTVALCGWLRPRILVPQNFKDRFNDEEIRGVFLHELAHVKRHDVLWSWLSLTACALHWFNPLAWLVARRFRADRELECDRLALKTLDPGQRRHFGEALLKTLEGQQWSVSPALVSFAQRQPEIRTRILMIARPLSPLWIRCLSLLAAPGLILLTLNNASADGEKEPGKAREGEGVKKTGPRDGEGQPRTGARDGEGAKKGPRDGEGGKKTGARDGEGTRKAAEGGEGAARKKSGGEGEKAVAGNALIIRAIDKGENVVVDGTKVDAHRLRAHLSEFLPEQKGRPVVIEADEDVPYKTVMEVLDAARDNGAKKATLRTTKG